MEDTTRVEPRVTEDQIINPLVDVLDRVASPQLQQIPHQSNNSITELFPEQEFTDKSVKKAKEILGDLAKNFSDSELKDVIAQVEYLAESWLDDFERDIFEGQTLRELLHERSK